MPAKLRPVPDTPPRALALIRVSKERTGMISPEIQRSAITDYAAARGYQITGEVEGLDESGSMRSSAWWARLDQAVSAVEAGKYDVIVVWKFSRTARNRLKWAVAIDKVETAGGRLESATEQVDTTTSTGRFTRGMLAELNAFEAERIGEVWKEVHQSRLARGLLPGGQQRFGYQRVDGSDVQLPHPEHGPLLVRMYDLFIAGTGFRGIAHTLNDEGHRTLRGRAWKAESVLDVLDSGFGAGLVKWNGEMHPGAHEALIDQDTWHAYLDRREASRMRPSRSKGSPYLLSGLMRCSRCQGPMTAAVATKTAPPSWRCRRRTEYGNGDRVSGCWGGSVRMAIADRYVRDWVTGYADLVDKRAEAMEDTDIAQVSAEGAKRRVEREIASLLEQIDELTDQLAEKVIRPEAYSRAVGRLEQRLGVKRDQLEEAARDVREASRDRKVVAARLAEDWDDLPVDMIQTLLRDLIEAVVLTSKPPLQTGRGAVSQSTFEVLER